MSKIFHHTQPLPRFTDPGGYPLFYLSEYEVLCADCATKEKHLRPTKSLLSDVHWEGEALMCEDCGELIPSAYGFEEN